MKLRLTGEGPDDPKKKKVTKVSVKKPFDFGEEMRAASGRPLKYDSGKRWNDVVISAAQKGKIDPSFLATSSWVEGLNKAVADPDAVSEAYNVALAKDKDLASYPVDAFYNYGLDTFGNNYEALKKYLPQGFEQRFKMYDALNEKKEKIRTAAFRNNEDALVAKAAFLNMEGDNIDRLARAKGVQLDDKAKKYLTLASYNAGPGNGRIMLDEYIKAPDKNAFIDQGLTSRGAVHKNISPRMQKMALAAELLGQQQSQPQILR